MKSKYLDLILALMLFAVVVSGFATTWTQTSQLSRGPSIGMSADGRIILAVPSTYPQPAISTNRGQTWVNVTNPSQYASGHASGGGVALSADGTTIISMFSTNNVVGVYVTTNYGRTWQADLLTTNEGSLVVACSGDATRQIAAGTDDGLVYFSTNAGINWIPSSVLNASQGQNWTSVASSADGRLMAAIVNGGKLYLSTNFGTLWVPTNLPVLSWNSVCVSGDGHWVGATGANGTYISSTGGASWITNKLNGQGVACSADGTDWIISGTSAYTSSDGGVTWVTNLLALPTGGSDAGVSADGCEFIVFDWLGHTTPSPQLNIQPTNGNMALSWLVPSTNFVLQQNSDLTTTNWVTVSNSPILNFTNLQDEVSIPASPSNGFFRLIAQ